MAKHNIKQSKTERLLAKVRAISSFKAEPIVIPRNKIDIAHSAVKKAQDKNKYLITIIITLIGVLIWMVSN